MINAIHLNKLKDYAEIGYNVMDVKINSILFVFQEPPERYRLTSIHSGKGREYCVPFLYCER